MKKILKFLHERQNGEKMKDFLPSTTFNDMLHSFSKKNTKGISIFENCLYQISDMKWLNFVDYKQENPANQLLLHGMMYKALLDIYTKYLGINLDDPFLVQRPSVKPIALSWDEYQKLQKKYRGIWKQTDDGYVLNITKQPMVIVVQKRYKDRLKQLLKRADMLLPVIYKETMPDIDIGGKLQLFEASTRPAFVSNSISVNRVSNEQLKTINELYDIFIEISKITFPIETKISNDKTSGALNIFNEHMDELTRKNIFVKTKDKTKAIQVQKQIELQDTARKYQKDTENINAKYTHLHNEIITLLKQQTSVNIQ